MLKTTNQVHGIWWCKYKSNTHPDLRLCVCAPVLAGYEKRPGYQSGSMSGYQIIYLLVLLSFFCCTRPTTYSAWYQCFRYPENTVLTGYQFHKIQYPISTPMRTSHTYLDRFHIFHSFFLHPRAFIELRFDFIICLKSKT